MASRFLTVTRCTLFLVIAAITAAPRLAVGVTPLHLDIFQGPVVSSQRMVGLGGAFIGVADGAEGQSSNPAAFAVRSPFFGNTWFDWDFALSAYSVVGKNDIDMSGVRRLDSAQLVQFGFNLKFGRFGIGLHTSGQQYAMHRLDGDGIERHYDFAPNFGGFGFGYAFFDGELVVGGLLSVGSVNISASQTAAPVKLTSDLKFHQVGTLYAPRDRPWRFGVMLQLPVTMEERNAANEVQQKTFALGGMQIPDAVAMPWQAGVGVSYMLGQRPYNLRPSYGAWPLPDDVMHAKHIPRQYVLLAADLVLIGPTENAFGVQPFLANAPLVSGRSAVASARAGIESEVIDHRLTLRTGSYFEPSRYDDRLGRWHWTGGGDLRCTIIWDWRISWVFDVAPDYTNTAIGFGLWH